MTNLDKLELLNQIPIDDYDCDGESCYYVEAVVEDAKEILLKIGVTEKYIQINSRYLPEDNYSVIDLNPIGFGVLEATWWDNANGYTYQ